MELTSNILNDKKVLRARMRTLRDSLDARAHAEAGEAVAAQGLDFLQPKAGAVVSGFSPMPGEFRVWHLLRRLVADGFSLVLPVMQGKGLPLLFRAWKPGDAMDSGVWGISEPKVDKAVLEPDILIVPLLAFDPRGMRLGYGGGYYDRTLAGLRARKEIVAVGIGYDQQEVADVPHLDYDERLDWVLTPSGPIRCQTSKS